MKSESEIEAEIYPIFNTAETTELIKRAYYKHKDAKWLKSWLVKKIAEKYNISIAEEGSLSEIPEVRYKHYREHILLCYVYNVISSIEHYEKQRSMGFY